MDPPGSALAEAVRRSHPSVLLDRFDWSGDNDIFARREAALALAKHVQGVSASHPTARHILLGHSHGGNVILNALEQAPS